MYLLIHDQDLNEIFLGLKFKKCYLAYYKYQIASHLCLTFIIHSQMEYEMCLHKFNPIRKMGIQPLMRFII